MPPVKRTAKPAKASTNGSAPEKAAPVIEADPDALGDEGRAELTAQMYAQVAEQIERLRLTQLTNGADDDDPVPGIFNPDGTSPTYAERHKLLVESKQRLRNASQDCWPLVEKVLEKAKQQRRQALEA